jgi:hypothetical protein
LIPVPPRLWHLTILFPFLRVPFPSQFLHGFFFSPMLFRIVSSQFIRPNVRAELRVLPLREDHRRTSNGDQTYRVAGLAMKRKQSVDFTGYWQRHVAAN